MSKKLIDTYPIIKRYYDNEDDRIKEKVEKGKYRDLFPLESPPKLSSIPKKDRMHILCDKKIKKSLCKTTTSCVSSGDTSTTSNSKSSIYMDNAESCEIFFKNK